MSAEEMTTVRTVQSGDQIRFNSKWDTRVWDVDWAKTLPTGDVELWVSRTKGEHGQVAYAAFTMLPDAWVFRTVVTAEDLLGVAPDFTAGLSVDEYMDEQRGRGAE